MNPLDWFQTRLLMNIHVRTKNKIAIDLKCVGLFTSVRNFVFWFSYTISDKKDVKIFLRKAWR